MYVDGMPDEAFVFKRRELDRWADGRPHKLEPGIHFPAHFAREDIKRRLVLAAKRRDVDISVWYLDGNVHFVMAPWARFQGANP